MPGSLLVKEGLLRYTQADGRQGRRLAPIERECWWGAEPEEPVETWHWSRRRKDGDEGAHYHERLTMLRVMMTVVMMMILMEYVLASAQYRVMCKVISCLVSATETQFFQNARVLLFHLSHLLTSQRIPTSIYATTRLCLPPGWTPGR